MYNFNTDQGIICLFFMLRQLSNCCVFICYCLVQAVTVFTVLQSGHTFKLSSPLLSSYLIDTFGRRTVISTFIDILFNLV